MQDYRVWAETAIKIDRHGLSRDLNDELVTRLGNGPNVFCAASGKCSYATYIHGELHLPPWEWWHLQFGFRYIKPKSYKAISNMVHYAVYDTFTVRYDKSKTTSCWINGRKYICMYIWGSKGHIQALNRRQTITWTNEDPFHQSIHMSPAGHFVSCYNVNPGRSNHRPIAVWDGITCPFAIFDGCAVEVWI